MQLSFRPRPPRLRQFFRNLATASIVAVWGAGAPALAQGQFAPAIRVNDDVITFFELEQRALFLQLLQVPGDPQKQARTALIEDRLKLQATKAAGIAVAPEDIQAGIEVFAARTNLPAEEFVKAVVSGGVSYETLRDFVSIGLAWRELSTARFLARSRPSEAEIDAALGRAGSGGGIQVLLSEVIIPLTPQSGPQVQALAEQISQLVGVEAFSDAARQYSATATASQGGKMDWLAINALPPGLRPVILALNPGDVSAPIALPDAVALFQMRGMRETGVSAVRYSAIEYASYYIPGGRSAAALATAARVSQSVDTCDDLYGIAKDQPPEVLERVSLKPGEISRDVALELAKLDDGEISTALTRSNGQTLVLLMLCGRTAVLDSDTSREDVAVALTQQRVSAFSNSYLEQLRADALIVAE
jgi:peptidyl-prolyl cis-trans isomerase SurA